MLYARAAAAMTNGQLWFQPSFLDALKDLGTPVHVNENEDQRVQALQGIERSILRARAEAVGFYFE
jgi:hypothetical protein